MSRKPAILKTQLFFIAKQTNLTVWSHSFSQLLKTTLLLFLSSFLLLSSRLLAFADFIFGFSGSLLMFCFPACFCRFTISGEFYYITDAGTKYFLRALPDVFQLNHIHMSDSNCAHFYAFVCNKHSTSSFTLFRVGKTFHEIGQYD